MRRRPALFVAAYFLVAPLCASPCLAQGADKFVTLDLEKTGPTRCRVLNSWTSDDGSKCMQLQSVGSGTLMTVVQSSRGSNNAGEVNVYPWGPEGVSPPGVPVPNESGLVRTVSASRPVANPTGNGMKGGGSGMKGSGSKLDTGITPLQPVPQLPAASVPVEAPPQAELPARPKTPVTMEAPAKSQEIIVKQALDAMFQQPSALPSVNVPLPQQAQGAQPNTISITVSIPPGATPPLSATSAPVQAAPKLEEARLPQRESQVSELSSNPQVLRAVIDTLNSDVSPTVRVAAAKALGKLGNGSEEVIRVLLKHRNDPDVRIRAEVDRALVLIIAARTDGNLP